LKTGNYLVYCCLVAHRKADNLGVHEIDALSIHFNEFGESMLTKMENKVMDKIELIANDHQKFIREFGFLRIFSTFSVLDDDDLALLANLFSHADEVVRFKSQ
jgi:hypothetical protein